LALSSTLSGRIWSGERNKHVPGDAFVTGAFLSFFKKLAHFKATLTNVKKPVDLGEFDGVDGVYA